MVDVGRDEHLAPLPLGGGGDGSGGDVDHYDGEYFSPPYLFRGPRPSIDSAPTSARYKESFALQASDPTGISAVTLVALSSTTHEFNQSQRFIRLAFAPGAEPNRYEVTAPADANIARSWLASDGVFRQCATSAGTME